MGEDGTTVDGDRSAGRDPGRSAGSGLGTVAGLVSELSELTSLILATDALDKVVWEAAMLAVHAIDQVDACGVTVLRDGAALSIMPDTAPYAKLETYQYEHDGGPILAAIAQGRTVVTTLSQLQDQWPAYAALSRELDVSCSLVVPLIVGEEVLGALSLYSTAADCDLTVAQNLGELVADLASTALSCVARHAEKTKLTEELQQALVSRAVIEQAKGVLIATHGLDVDSAFTRLRRTSQNHNIKLRDVAAVIVDTHSSPTCRTASR